MDSFTKELVSNASGELFPDKKTQFFLQNFLPEEVNLEVQWDVAISEISMYQNITEGSFKFFDEKLENSTLQTKTWAIQSHHRHCGCHEHAHPREKQPQRILQNSQGFSQNAKSCNYDCKRYL